MLDIASRTVFAVWVAWSSVYAMRAGLFTSFLGYWGVGAAAALVLLPVGDAMYIGWLASVGSSPSVLAGWPSRGVGGKSSIAA